MLEVFDCASMCDERSSFDTRQNPNVTVDRQKNKLYMVTASREWPTEGRPTND